MSTRVFVNDSDFQITSPSNNMIENGKEYALECKHPEVSVSSIADELLSHTTGAVYFAVDPCCEVTINGNEVEVPYAFSTVTMQCKQDGEQAFFIRNGEEYNL